MKLTRQPVKGSRYVVHDGSYRMGSGFYPLCRPSDALSWHLLPAHATTTCKRCLALREQKPASPELKKALSKILSMKG